MHTYIMCVCVCLCHCVYCFFACLEKACKVASLVIHMTSLRISCVCVCVCLCNCVYCIFACLEKACKLASLVIHMTSLRISCFYRCLCLSYIYDMSIAVLVTCSYGICSDTYMTKGSDTYDISPTYTSCLSLS